MQRPHKWIHSMIYSGSRHPARLRRTFDEIDVTDLLHAWPLRPLCSIAVTMLCSRLVRGVGSRRVSAARASSHLKVAITWFCKLTLFGADSLTKWGTFSPPDDEGRFKLNRCDPSRDPTAKCPLWAKSGHQVAYLITSSTWASSAGDTARPSTFAVRILFPAGLRNAVIQKWSIGGNSAGRFAVSCTYSFQPQEKQHDDVPEHLRGRKHMYDVSDEALETVGEKEIVANFTLGSCTGLSECPAWSIWTD